MNDIEIKKLITSMDEYIDKLYRILEEEPERAKEIALLDLKRSGILDCDGNLKYPYNREVSQNGDFSRGPKYNFECETPQTVIEFIEELNIKSQNKQRKLKK